MARLNAGLFIGGDDEIIGTERLTFPDALIQIENGTGLFNEPGIAREDPATMPPRTKSIFAEPAPYGGSTDLSHESLIENFLTDVGHREARERKAPAVRQFTSESFYLNDETGGKSGPYARLGVRPRGLANRPDRIACATC